ncbi:cation/H(+) antiporter 20-like [Telopea speciosissima]|uniref:cation/H(+) antiporter 20-like n=1 Tax=Telopea speciosissima TaxID=54955 RepID=UPI001CC34388|nr:cation/H(+) antiporter 20-like [Telopea speciosissima]
MTFNLTSVKTSSNGVWQGDNPLDYAFPLLIIQITLVLVVGRSLAFLFKPLRQPNVIAEIVGGILLGPSALGRNKTYLHRIFPSWSTPILESVASIGLLFFLFLVGLELDLKSIRRSGRRAFGIAAAGITLPFISGIGVAYILRTTVQGAKEAGYPQFLVFMGVSLSITAFPVLARILAELKLLTTQVGETAMAAAAFNDLAAWVLLALAVALAGNGSSGEAHKRSPVVCVWVLLSGVAFVVFMLMVIRPVMTWVGRRCSPEIDAGDEVYIFLTLGGVLVCGFMTDLIGIHSIFGAFVFGLTIPKEGEFARRLIERIEDFVSGLLLPLYFASSGLKTDVTKMHGAEAWGLLVLVIATACAGKILGTFFAAMINRIPARESLTLGVLMNTKGLVELIVLNIGKEKKVLNDEIFAILVLMALFTTFVTTPIVIALYKPAREAILPTQRKLQRESPSNPKDELRILACVHGPGNVPSLINLIESTRGNNKSPLKLYIMHLVELTERTSSIIMAQRALRNGFPFIDRLHKGDSHDGGITVAFEAYGQLGRVLVRTVTAISALHTMHEDVCHVVEEKKVSMVILPFHKHGRGDGSCEMDNVGHSWRMVNQRILKESPCSVAVLVDRGLGGGAGPKRNTPSASATVAQGICIVFFGGPDDREALELGGRMAEHPGVRVTVIRFMEEQGAPPPNGNIIMLQPTPEKCSEKNYSFSTAVMDRESEKELDEMAVAEFRRRWEGMAEYTEKMASNNNNIVEGVVAIGRSGQYELIVVGKGRFPSTMVADLAERSAEHPELGPIGDVLASSSHGVVSSVLVIQQHDVVHANETPVCKIVDGGDYVTNTANSSTTANANGGANIITAVDSV